MSACQSRGLSACYLGSGQRDATVAPAAWRGDFELVYITPELAAHNVPRIKSLQSSVVRTDECEFVRNRKITLAQPRQKTADTMTKSRDAINMLRACAWWLSTRRIV